MWGEFLGVFKIQVGNSSSGKIISRRMRLWKWLPRVKMNSFSGECEEEVIPALLDGHRWCLKHRQRE